MKKYESVPLKTRTGLMSSKLQDYREVINAYAAKGYRYVGWFPKKTSNMLSGVMEEVDLIFEIDA